jgi:hypothetical protein
MKATSFSLAIFCVVAATPLAHAEDGLQRFIAAPSDPLSARSLSERFMRTGSFVGRESSGGDASTHMSLQGAVQQIGEPQLLSEWQIWRAALRGEGEIANREFWILPAKEPQTGAKLRIGARPNLGFSLANMHVGPGVQLSANGFSAGSTAPLGILNQALAPVDKWLSPDQQTSSDDSQTSWISAPQFQAGNFSLQTAMLLGRRDLTPWDSSDQNFARGALWGTSAQWNFAPRWNLRSEWMNSRGRGEEKKGAAWRAQLHGPIAHPWGEASFSAQVTDASENFAPFTGGVAAGERRSDVNLVQNINMGPVSGAIGASWNQTQNASWQNEALEGRANFDLKLSEMLSVTSRHRARRSESSTQNLLETNNNLGLKMRLSQALDVTLGAGQSRYASTQMPQHRQENSLLAGLQMRAGGGFWRVNMERRLNAQFSSEQNRTLRIEGEQPLFDWLKVRGSWKISDQMRDDIFQREDADRRAEAEFALRSLGNLTLRLSDWQQNQISNDSAAREFGIRYAYGDGSGLGLSFEYSQREHLSQDAQKEWRIGFTYR